MTAKSRKRSITMDERPWKAWVGDANSVLSTCRGSVARWWSFGPPCSTFQIVIGDPVRSDLAIMLTWLDYLSGPTSWPQRDFRIELDSHGSDDWMKWEYTLLDEAVGFRAIGKTFHWAPNVDVVQTDAWRLWRPPSNLIDPSA